MTQELSTDIQGIVDETKELISFGQKVVLQVSANVVKLREELYPEQKRHKEFVNWCYKELGIKASQTSKYESIGDYYFLDGQYTPESFLTDGKYRDYEVVYASTKLPGTREENFAHALTWTRDDFKATRAADIGEHSPVWVKYCDVCGKSEETHATNPN